jgi:SAM-dependent methyltransferase
MQTRFSKRSDEYELLDAPDIPENLLHANLRELDLINKTLGGHSITLSGIKKLLKDKNKVYRIVDIGCGGGDAMIQIAKWGRANGFKLQLTGVDMNPDCISYMKTACQTFSEITGVVSDYRDYLKIKTNVDIIHCSLFCHHLKDDELTELFDYMNRFAVVGFVINDLQRHWFAYYSIKYITRLFNGSALVKNDAPLSVLRGFRKKELKIIFKSANVQNIEISWKWAFRYLVVLKK